MPSTRGVVSSEAITRAVNNLALAVRVSSSPVSNYEFEAVQKRDIGDWFEMVNLNRGDGVSRKLILDMMIFAGFEAIVRKTLNEKF